MLLVLPLTCLLSLVMDRRLSEGVRTGKAYLNPLVIRTNSHRDPGSRRHGITTSVEGRRQAYKVVFCML